MTVRTLVLVLGMHRSGTSYAGSVCEAAGLPTLGRTFPGDSWNRGGYFEAADIVAAHDALLATLQRPWWDLYDLPADWLDTPAAKRCEDKIVAAIERHAPQGDFFVKDPRASRLLALWQRSSARIDVRLVALVMMRPAPAVAESLLARDDINLSLGMLLWWCHQREIGKGIAAAGISAMPIAYQTACAEPELIVQALRDLGAAVDPVEKKALRALARPELDHSTERAFPLEDHPVTIACREAYAAILGGEWPAALGAQASVDAMMSGYPAWRQLYERHYELLGVTRGAFARLRGYRPVAGRSD